jgi:chaperone required for assembly of F1-ATPase
MPAGQRIKRFYKKVDVIEHPLSHEVKKIDASDKVTLNNLSLSHNKYYGVTLDGRVTKTFYKDNLLLPTRALAVALAEEWES